MQRTSLLRLALIGLAASAALTAQSPLTTTFVNDNGGSVGGGVYFDLNVTTPGGITISGLDLNLTGTGSIEVWTIGGTRVGNQTNAAAWTLATTGTVTGAVAGTPAPVAIGPVVLAAGSYGIALKTIGVSHSYTNGNGTNQNYSTAELALSAGEASNVAFVAPLFTPRVVNCNIHYTGGAGGTLATNTTLGAGCPNGFDSFYESFANASAASAALSGNVLFLSSTGNGYQGVWAPGAAASQFVTPVGATPLATGDDGTVAFSPSIPLSTPYGPQAMLQISGNGVIGFGNGILDFPGTNTYTPTAAGFLNATLGGIYSWHDFNQAEAGSGQIVTHEAGGTLYVTFNDVENYANPETANRSTMQFQLDLATGNVRIVWVNIDGNATSTWGSGHLIGVSAPGASNDPGSVTLSTATSAQLASVSPLSLTAITRPITGTAWSLRTGSIPASGAIGVQVLGLTDPGINDLFFIGAPGCGLRANLDALSVFIVTGATHNWSVAIPANPTLVGLHLYATSAIAQVPAVNAFGFITSNGIDGLLGDI